MAEAWGGVQFAVPSRGRADTIAGKTLGWLARAGVPMQAITVFVADQAERAAYERTVPRGLYGSLQVGRAGLRQQRNFIQAWYRGVFGHGVKVVSIDDDLTGLVARVSEKVLQPVTNLEEVVKTGFEMTERGQCRLWGIYPVRNAYFMKPDVSYRLAFISGGFWGCIISEERRAVELAEDLWTKEDIERTIKYYLADGAVCRINYLAMLTDYSTGVGGVQAYRTEERNLLSARVIAERYPQLCSVKFRSDGRAELTLRDKRPKTKTKTKTKGK